MAALNDTVVEPRPTLAVCVITLDEEDRIGDCLDSVAWADEVLVVDAGSADRTAAIARERGARVIVRDWPGYAAQKNFALGQVGADWVLSLDADERVTPELATGIRGLLAAPGEGTAGASVRRRTWYLGRWIRHGGWYPDRKVRLVRRGRGRWEGGHVHERLVVDGGIRQLDGDLLHLTYRDLADHLRTINRYTAEAAREMAARGRRGALGGLIVGPPLKFLKMYLLQAGFLDGLPGLIAAVMGSYYVFLKHAKLWELRLRRKTPSTGAGGAGRPRSNGN
jgi:glycosyltransferase involved in cell wall biosynthesis